MCFFKSYDFWEMYMAGSVGKIFSYFEGEACVFPASKIASRIGCLGFVSGDLVQLTAEVWDVFECLLVHRKLHCQGDGSKDIA